MTRIDWQPISNFYLAAFLVVGMTSVGGAVFFMIAGVDGKLTVALAACGATSFGYVVHRLTPPKHQDEESRHG